MKGIFVGATDSLPILHAARRAGRLAGLAIVTTDFSPAVLGWIHAGEVAAAIYQRPLEQGHVAIRLLYEYLQTRRLPNQRRQVIAPYAVTRSNLPLVLERHDVARVAGRSDANASRSWPERARPVAKPGQGLRGYHKRSQGSRLDRREPR